MDNILQASQFDNSQTLLEEKYLIYLDLLKNTDIFIHNKYYNWYYSIIERAYNRDPKSIEGEWHHFVPKSIIKNKDKVKLTLREHFICHKILIKITEGKNKAKMWFALCMISNMNKSKINSRKYEKIMEAVSKNSKGKYHPRFGKHLSNETKKKISESNKGSKHYLFGKHISKSVKKKMSDAKKGGKSVNFGKHPPKKTLAKLSKAKSGKNNPMYGKKRHHSKKTKNKISKSLKGHPVSKKTRIKLSKTNSGKNAPMYGVHRFGKDAPNFGKKHSKETKKKMSESRKGRIVSKESIRKRLETIAKLRKENPSYGKAYSKIKNQ